ncbi:hypothetical protein IPG41_06790 [Candidatus Peregrinibacteria bacterium]|nr:MAG: hypothetical protein IPG41_06790 [Candidatus Peregrinibacteria bacterium]
MGIERILSGDAIAAASIMAPAIIRKNPKYRKKIKERLATLKRPSPKSVELEKLGWAYHLSNLFLISGFVAGGILMARALGDEPSVVSIINLFIRLFMLPFAIELLLLMLYELVPTYKNYHCAQELERLLYMAGEINLEPNSERFFTRLKEISSKYDLDKQARREKKTYLLCLLFLASLTVIVGLFR